MAAGCFCDGFQSRGDRSSNVDLTRKISHSVFIFNFPDSVTSRDLWRECNVYDKVVDVFIPAKLSKAGKRFAFVRFIKVVNLDRLVENLCTLWIGRHHLFANHVRFEIPPKSSGQKVNFPPLNQSDKSLGSDVKEKVYVLDTDSVRGEKINDSSEEEEEGEILSSEVKRVAESIFGDNSSSLLNQKEVIDEQQSADPFKIYEILN
nr:RNA-directed DNA polymerase, eukaryota, nucleotide-binding alpha-beta plait domain protein [Tanacetum cinerariifolium]